VYRWLLLLYGRLPRRVRRSIVRRTTPSFTVGAVCFIERADGRVLLIRQSYRHDWGLPGGLLQRHELPAEAARREIREETGLDIVLVSEPAVVIDPSPRRVDVVFRARLVDDADAERARPTSVEIVEVGWFPPAELPRLQFETTQAIQALARAKVASLIPPA